MLTWLDEAFGFCFFNHIQAYPVFHAAAGLLSLQLCSDTSLHAFCNLCPVWEVTKNEIVECMAHRHALYTIVKADLIEIHHRSVSNEVGDTVGNFWPTPSFSKVFSGGWSFLHGGSSQKRIPSSLPSQASAWAKLAGI
jgi:hypothetical protein